VSAVGRIATAGAGTRSSQHSRQYGKIARGQNHRPVLSSPEQTTSSRTMQSLENSIISPVRSSMILVMRARTRATVPH
jgi:hypothetical protein